MLLQNFGSPDRGPDSFFLPSSGSEEPRFERAKLNAVVNLRLYFKLFQFSELEAIKFVCDGVIRPRLESRGKIDKRKAQVYFRIWK